MKNLYKKGKVYPSPPPPPSSPPSIAATNTFLSFLPATILTLTAALSPQDKEVLSYLISCCERTSTNTSSVNFSGHRRGARKSNDHGGGSASTGGGGEKGDHGPTFECSCFRCYMSFWARWDASSNRQVIHEIIEAYEEELLFRQKRKTSVRRKKESGKRMVQRSSDQNGAPPAKGELGKVESVQEQPSSYTNCQDNEDVDNNQVDLEKSAVRKIVSFVGDRIWNVWRNEFN